PGLLVFTKTTNINNLSRNPVLHVGPLVIALNRNTVNCVNWLLVTNSLPNHLGLSFSHGNDPVPLIKVSSKWSLKHWVKWPGLKVITIVDVVHGHPEILLSGSLHVHHWLDCDCWPVTNEDVIFAICLIQFIKEEGKEILLTIKEAIVSLVILQNIQRVDWRILNRLTVIPFHVNGL